MTPLYNEQRIVLNPIIYQTFLSDLGSLSETSMKVEKKSELIGRGGFYRRPVVWFRKVIPRGSCVHCTVEFHLADFFSFLSFINEEKIHQISYIRTQPSTLRSWCNLVEWPYRVKKISIKWLLPVKVTLKVIKRHFKVFCWSCDEDPLKWEKKICRASSLLLRIEWAYSHLSVRMVGQYL